MRWSAETARDRFTVVRDRLIALDARRRLWVWRHPRPVAAMIALLCLLALQSRIDAARAVERSTAEWGQVASVLVATADLTPGEPLDGRWETRRLPAPALPDRAVVDPSRLMDAVVTARATSGTVITEAHVSATVAIPDGWLGVPAPRRGVAAGVGDPVTVALDGRLVTDRAVIASIDDDTVTVALPAGAAAIVAARPEDAVVLLAS